MPPAGTLVQGTIRTSPFEEPVDWLLSVGGRVETFGFGDPPDALVRSVRALTLPPGAVAVPVLHDAHVHLLGTGLLELGVDLSSVASIDELLGIVADAVREREEPLIRAHSFDPDTLDDARYPTMSELDSAAGSTPVFVKRRDGHSSSVNTAAYRLMGLEPTTDGVETDGTGSPTGVLRRAAHNRAAALSSDLLTDEEKVRALHLGSAAALRAGAGVVHALVGREDPEDREIELVLDVADELPVDVVVYPQTTDVDRVASLGLPRIGGCILLDGSFGSRTAALLRPYHDGPGDGVLYYGDDELTSFIGRAHGRGMQVAVHAIGDRAVHQAVRCLEAAVGSDAREARHRIEHCELVDAGAVAGILRLGAGVCVQPAFERYWGGPGGLYEKRLGTGRMRRTNPYRSMLDSGVPLGAGSDSYVTPIDPLGGMAAAAARPVPEHDIDPAEALALFTSGAAWLAFDEHRVGTLREGSEASFTVLDADPARKGARADEITVLGVYLRGEEAAPDPSSAS